MAIPLVLGSHGLGMIPSLHPLHVRQPQQRATCAYEAFRYAEPPKEWNSYTFFIDLPGAEWKTMCSEMIMKQILDSIKARCLQKWTEDDTPREFKELSASHAMKDGQCRVTIHLIAESTKDAKYPKFDSRCLLNPKPEPCGLATQTLPWPSVCRRKRTPDFTPAEDKRLKELKEAGVKWGEIAKQFPERTKITLQNRYWGVLAPGLEPPPGGPVPPQGEKGSIYTAEEDWLLASMRENGASWPEVADAFSQRFPGQGRSGMGLRNRYEKLLNHRKNRDPGRDYTPEEDALIKDMRANGRNWDEIAEVLPGRSMAAVITRWYAALEQDTAQQDERLKKLVKEGLSWEQIAKHFLSIMDELNEEERE